MSTHKIVLGLDTKNTNLNTKPKVRVAEILPQIFTQRYPELGDCLESSKTLKTYRILED